MRCFGNLKLSLVQTLLHDINLKMMSDVNIMKVLQVYSGTHRDDSVNSYILLQPSDMLVKEIKEAEANGIHNLILNRDRQGD